MIEGWEIKTIQEIAKTTSGGTPNRNNKSYFNGNILWVKSGELNDNYIYDTEEKITEDAVENSSAKKFPAGTVLIAMYGATVGKTAILKVPATTNQAVCGILPNTNECNNEFLRFQLMFKREDFLKQRYGGAQPNISQTIIKTFEILLPPLSEQHKIAYVLSTVQKAIEQQDKLIRTTTELKKALMQKLFTQGTKGEKQKMTEIGPVPESWEVTTIGEMYDFTSKPRNLYIKFPVPFIPMDLVPFNEIYIENYEFRENLSSGTYVENGDLLIAKITPSFENGKQGIVAINKPFSYATTEVIPIKEKTGISDKFYLFYYLLKDDVRKQLTDKMEGSTGRQRLSKTVLQKTLIPKPPVFKQKEISKILLSLNKKILFHQKKKQILTDLFKTLLHELMTGQRRVHEIEFEALNTEVKEMSTSI